MAAAGLLAAVGAGTAPAPAAAQAGCSQPPPAAEPIPELPWAQELFAPERVWPLSQGDGVVVAVIDTGVDTSHPQLDGGQVRTGTDLLPEPAGAHVDCDSHGTAVASVIAASRAAGIGFSGLAPEAEILPVRVAERNVDATDPAVHPARFAEAIRWAADHGARVINASIVFYQDHPGIAAAVRYAVERGALVVAAVGSLRLDDGSYPTPFPAGYPDVIGVGSIGPGGTTGATALTTTSYAGPHLDLVAPGEVVTAATAVAGHRQWSGSSFAAPFVSAAAALLLAAEPDLTAAEAARRLTATADPGPGSPEASGHGVVNPYRALTERVVDLPPGSAGPPAEPAVDEAAQARAERWQRAGQLAVLIALGAVGLGGLVAGGLAAWRRGHRRGWRPTRRPEPAPPPSAVDDPERAFFTVPTPRRRR